MKIYFNDKGALIVEAEDNTEMVALESWHSGFHRDGGSSVIGFMFDEHLKVQETQDVRECNQI